MKVLTQFLSLVIIVLFVLSCTESKKESRDRVNATRPDSVYINAGNAIVARTFDTLRNSLLMAIGDVGIEGAIGFCNERAIGLTTLYEDSVTIRRTALRLRNKHNQSDSLELSILDRMNASVASLNKSSFEIVKLRGEVHFFKPIIMQPMCINCHGKKDTEIQKTTLAIIKQLYPTDQAVNFNVNELRGVWHIIFKDRKKEG